MKIFEYLDLMREHLKEQDWDETESKYRELAVKMCGEKLAGRIAKVDLSEYQDALCESLSKAVEQAENLTAKAVYFEYDIDNDWQGVFLICPDYLPESEEDDDWACEWDDEVEGPSLTPFAKIYKKYGAYGDDEKGNGVTLFLIARTVCTFARCVDQLASTQVAICIGFHDQDPIWRILDIDNDEE